MLSIVQEKHAKFTLCNKPSTNFPKLSLQGHKVPFTATIKYFCAHLDIKLIFKENLAKFCKMIKEIRRNILSRMIPFTKEKSTTHLRFIPLLTLPLLLC